MDQQRLESTRSAAAQAMIGEAYRAFADGPVPMRLTAAAGRDPGRIVRILTATPLSKLTPEDLGAYGAWAMTTVGSIADYRHFLPRILELGLVPTSWHGLEPWLIASKTDYGSWRTWPRAQQAAVTRWCEVAFAWSLEASPGVTHEPQDWLAAAALLGLSLEPFLDGWRRAIRSTNAARLALFVDQWADAQENGEQAPAIWRDVDPPIRKLVERWLSSDTTRLPLARPH